jgi:hypothetical protein
MKPCAHCDGSIAEGAAPGAIRMETIRLTAARFVGLVSVRQSRRFEVLLPLDTPPNGISAGQRR